VQNVTQQLTQSNVVAFVQRHQTHEAARPRSPSGAAETVIESGVDHLMSRSLGHSLHQFDCALEIEIDYSVPISACRGRNCIGIEFNATCVTLATFNS
jgi:hypothetical protein